MELLPKEILEQLPALYSQEQVSDPVVQVKYFTPDGSWTWYAVEYDGQDQFFGKVISHLCPNGELGYFSLAELRTVRGALGLPVERDIYFTAKPLSQCE